MSQSNQPPKMKVGNPKAYKEAMNKPPPRKGLVVNMSIEAFHYYRQIHHVDVLQWNGGVLMVRKRIQSEAVKEGVP